MTTYSIHFTTTRTDGSYSVSKMFETQSWSHSRRVLRLVEKVLDVTPKGRTTKKVEVTHIDYLRLETFVSPDWLKQLRKISGKLKYFESVNALASVIEANPTSLRIALLKARRRGEETATVRGVTFKYTTL